MYDRSKQESERLKRIYDEIDVAKQTELEGHLLLLIFLTCGLVFLFISKPKTDKSKIHWLFKHFDPWFTQEK